MMRRSGLARYPVGVSMNDAIPKRHHTVNDVMCRWPQTVSLFMHYGMACAGCPVGAFHTIEEAALEYRIPLRQFLAELRRAAIEGGGRSSRSRRKPAAAQAAAPSGIGRRRDPRPSAHPHRRP